MVPLSRPESERRSEGDSVHADIAAEERLRELMEALAELGLVQVEPLQPLSAQEGGEPKEADQVEEAGPTGEDGGGGGTPSWAPPEVAEPVEVEARVSALREVLEVFDTHAPRKRGLAANFVTLPLEVTRREYERALAETDIDGLRARVRELAEEISRGEHEVDNWRPSSRGRVWGLPPRPRSPGRGRFWGRSLRAPGAGSRRSPTSVRWWS